MTATGWTFDAVFESSACDIFSLLEYWAEEPPTHVTLALRYFGERKSLTPKTENEARGQLHALGQTMGVPAEPLPQHVREMAEWAEEQRARLNKRERSS